MSEHCLVCYNNLVLRDRLPCSCTICQYCFSQWNIQRAGQQNFNLNGPLITCPNQDCKFTYGNDQSVIYILPKQYQVQFTDQLLINYSRNVADMINCPNNKCNYYGIMSLRQCDKKYQCPQCNTQWFHNSQIKKWGLKDIFQFKNAMSKTYVYFFSKNCPSCGIPIQRISGCHRMTCKVCNAYFCWTCGKLFSNHQDYKCVFQSLGKSLIKLIPAFLLLKKLNYFKISKNYFDQSVVFKKSLWNIIKIPYTFICFMIRIIGYNLIIPLSVITFPNIRQINKTNYYINLTLWLPYILWLYKFIRPKEYYVFSVLESFMAFLIWNLA